MMQQQNVFITGASSGLGAALAKQYAQQGARVALLGRKLEALQDVQRQLENSALHKIYQVDVNDTQALTRAAHDFMREVGQVHVVIASAGISVGTLTEMPEDLAVLSCVMQTNVLAMVATFTPFIEHMKAQAHQARHGCRLVGIASVAGIRGLPGASAYSASKAAVISYCESLRVELRGSGIEVVTIAPGYIDTPMTQVNQYAMPFLTSAEKFAKAAYLAIAKGVSYRVIPWQMGVVAKLLRLLPNFVYDRLFAHAPRKSRQVSE